MDWIVVLLIVIGAIVNSSKKKQQAQKKAEKSWQNAADALDRVEESRPKGRISPAAKKELTDFFKSFGGEVLDEIGHGIPGAVKAFSERKSVNMPRKEAVSQPAAAIGKPAPAMGGSLNYVPAEYVPMASAQLKPDRPEGESFAEHAAHLDRMRAEEEHIHSARAQAAELRNMNLRRLRQAVIMSEVLDRPVALRRQKRYPYGQ